MTGSSGEHPRELLSAYLDGELSAAERAAVDAHLAGCAECREHLRSLRTLLSALRGEAVPAVPAGLDARIGRRLDAASVVPFRRRFAVPATIAATIAAIGLVSVILFEQNGRTVPAPTPRPPVLERQDLPRRLDEKKDADRSRQLPQEKSETDSLRSNAKEKPAPATPSLPPPPARDERAAEPAQTDSGVAGGVEGGAASAPSEPSKDAIEKPHTLGYVGAPSPTAKSATAARAAFHNAESGACAGGVIDAPVEGTWLVRDTDDASRRITELALKLGGRLVWAHPEAPLTLIAEIPAERYPTFVAAARAMEVLGLDDVRSVETAGCVRQRIVLRRVAVN